MASRGWVLHRLAESTRASAPAPPPHVTSFGNDKALAWPQMNVERDFRMALLHYGSPSAIHLQSATRLYHPILQT